MKYIVIIFWFFLLNIGYSQSFPGFEDNPVWHILFWENAEANHSYTESYSYLKDTSFCSENYNIIEIENRRFYIHIDDDIVKFKLTPACSAKDFLLYNFGAKSGDTFFIGYSVDLNSNVDSIEVIVDSVYFKDYNGIMRKSFDINPIINDGAGDNVWNTWIQGIGSTIHPLYSVFHEFSALELNYDLLCCDSSGVNIFKNNIYNTCDTTIDGSVGINNTNYIDIEVYPNPFKNQIRISSSNIELDLYKLIDIDGRIIMQGEIKRQIINTDFVNNGIYLLSVYDTKKQIVVNKIIIKI